MLKVTHGNSKASYSINITLHINSIKTSDCKIRWQEKQRKQKKLFITKCEEDFMSRLLV